MQVSLIWIPCPSEQPWKPRPAMHSYETRGGGPREAYTIVVVLVVMVVVVVMTIIAIGRDPLSFFCPPFTLSLSLRSSVSRSLFLSLSLGLSVSQVTTPPSLSIRAPQAFSPYCIDLCVCLWVCPSVPLCLYLFCLRAPEARSYPHARPSRLVLDLRVARAISAVSRWLRGSSRL